MAKLGTAARRITTGVAVIAAPACGVLTAESWSTINPYWFAGSIVAVAVAAGLPSWAAYRARRSELDARSAARREMSYTLAPILRRIANRAVADPASLRAEIPQMVVNAAAELIGPRMKTRSCYFTFEPGPPQQLTLDEHAGRPSPVRAQFEDGTPRGAAAIALVERDDHLFCENVDKKPPPNWHHDGDHSYKTFISVGVRTRTSKWGMLTVDTPTPGELNELDVDLLRVMGGLIAAAMTIAQSAGPVGGQQ
jgi:hypothetical protein